MDTLSQFLDSLLLNDASSFGLWQAFLALGIAYAGGVLSSLTPCIYPMIPITVSVVGGLSPGSDWSGETQRRVWRGVVIRSLLYLAGMTTVYAFLGVLAGLTGQVFGTLTNTQGWYLALGVIMSFAALIMLGVIPFDPQTWMATARRRLGLKPKSVTPSANKEVTAFGAFTLGATSGFIASPCTTPALTVILAFIAKTQSVGFGLFLMFGFSIGLGTLLLVIAIFTGALKVLPRSGNWMKTIEIVSGLLLLAFGEYLIYRAGAVGG